MPYILGLDLGDSQDYTASIILHQEQPSGCRPMYTAVLAHRFPLGTGYPEIVDTLVERFLDPAVRGYSMVADYTGCCIPIVQELR